MLRQQREHFLPLKVIRDRLARNGDVADFDDSSEYDGDGIRRRSMRRPTIDGDETDDTAPSFVRTVGPRLRSTSSTRPPSNGSYEAAEDEDEMKGSIVGDKLARRGRRWPPPRRRWRHARPTVEDRPGVAFARSDVAPQPGAENPVHPDTPAQPSRPPRPQPATRAPAGRPYPADEPDPRPT